MYISFASESSCHMYITVEIKLLLCLGNNLKLDAYDMLGTMLSLGN